jgi:hypothetical protein
VMGAGRAETDDDLRWVTDGETLDRPTPVPAGPHPRSGDGGTEVPPHSG